MFTIGVLTDKSAVMTSKTGKKFMIFKMTDLIKYNDLNLIKSNLERILQPKIEAN